MINKFKALISKVVSGQEAETQTTLLQMDGKCFNVECAIDEEVVDCEGEAFKQMDYQLLYWCCSSPAYLEDDPWFGSCSQLTEKQQDYMEQETAS